MLRRDVAPLPESAWMERKKKRTEEPMPCNLYGCLGIHWCIGASL